LTLSSRQRIVVQREIALLKGSGNDPKRLRLLQKQYLYAGIKPAQATVFAPHPAQ